MLLDLSLCLSTPAWFWHVLQREVTCGRLSSLQIIFFLFALLGIECGDSDVVEVRRSGGMIVHRNLVTWQYL